MDRGEWYDVSEFPDADEFESTIEFGEAVYESIIGLYKWKHGGKISETFEREARTFGHVWAFAKEENKVIITEDDIDFFTESVTGAESNLGFENNAKNVISRLSGRGFIPVQTDVVIEDLDWANGDELLVRTAIIPELSKVRSKILDGRVLPRNTLIDYSTELVTAHFDRFGIDEDPSPSAIGITAALENKLRRRSWFDLRVGNDSDRVWVEPESIFSKLLPEQDTLEHLPEEEINELVTEYLRDDLSIGRYVNGELVIDKLVTDFQVKLRSAGWGEIIHKGTSTWYTNEEALRDALAELHDTYEPIWETPNPNYRSVEEMVATLDQTYYFYSENSQPLKKFELVDTEEFDRKLRLLRAYREVADDWDRLDGAETAGGNWTIEFSEEGPGIVELDEGEEAV